MAERLIKVTSSGLRPLTAKVERVRAAVNQPNINKMVQGMAGIWQSNFDSEGGIVGGWRPLTKMTQDVRQQRGYPREHPILVQSGALRRAAADGLVNVNGPRVLTYKGVMMSYHPSQFGATLRISGQKVDNQFRNRNSEFSSPARPFWFTDHGVDDAAVAALHQWIVNEIG